MAHDKKPAGEKLFQGVVPPSRTSGRNIPLPLYPNRNRSQRKDAHDIFTMPSTLGGPKKPKSVMPS